MPQVKSMSAIKEKWGRVTPGRASDYKDGVENPTKDWATQTANSEDAYNSGVQEAIAQGRFGTGVKKAGTEKWQKKASELGASRWPAGVSAAVDDYEKGFAPFREVIEKTTLPPRGAKGSPQNIERVRTIAAALHKKKVQG